MYPFYSTREENKREEEEEERDETREREREMALAITTNLRSFRTGREAARLYLVEPSCLSRSRTSAFASTSAANSSAPALKISNGVSTRKTQSCSSTRRQLLCRSQKVGAGHSCSLNSLTHKEAWASNTENFSSSSSFFVFV